MAKYSQGVRNNTIAKDVPYFDLWDDSQFEKMINYMSLNNLIVVPGNYGFNQGWEFRNGKFIRKKLIGKKEFEVFKFKSK